MQVNFFDLAYLGALRKPAPRLSSQVVQQGQGQRAGQRDLVLRGTGPIRQGCEVIGLSQRSRALDWFERIKSK